MAAQNKRTFLYVLLVLILVAVGFWTAKNRKPGGTGSRGSVAESGGAWTLHDMTSQDITSLDPVKIVDFNTLNILAHCYEGLVNVDETMKIVPGLAENWTISGDGLVWAFTLKKDVIFQSLNGQQPQSLTAEDVVASLKRAITAKESFNRWVLGDVVAVTPAAEKGAEGAPMIEALSPNVVQITLKNPFPLLNRLCMAASWVYPKDFFDAPRDTAPGPAILGTGPYQLTEYVPSDHLVLERFAGYHGAIGEDAPDKVTIAIKQDPLASITEIKSKALDVVDLDFGNYKEAETLAALDAYHMLSVTGNELDYLVVNTKAVPYDDLRFRRALNRAIDRQVLSKALAPFAFPAKGYLPPLFDEGHLKEPIEYDPASARTLLAEYRAEHPEWNAVGLGLVFDDGLLQRLTAEFVKAQLKENLNLNIDIRQVTWPELLQGGFTGTLPFFRLWWLVATPTPDVYFQFYMPEKIPPNGLNLSFYENPAFSKAYAQTFGRTSLIDEGSDIRDLEQMLIDDAVAVPLIHRRYHFLIRDPIELKITPLLRKCYEQARRGR